MSRKAGNQLRASSATLNQSVADNLPNLYPVDDWRAYYWAMDQDGSLVECKASIHVPAGVSSISFPVEIGQQGVIENVRRWGVTLRGQILEDIDFDIGSLLSHDRSRFRSDDQEALHLATDATHFDLPGYFIIASDEHPFLLFDPAGELKGSFTQWYTHAGALAYLVTDGRLATSFSLTYEKDRRLYDKVMRALNELLAERKHDLT